MMKRLIRGIIHSLAVRVFATLEVLGIPKVPDGPHGEEKG